MRSAPLIVILLAGCVTLEDAKNSWHGASHDEVVLQWGAPNRQTTLTDGRQAQTWVAEGGGGGSSPVSVGVFGGSGGGGAGGMFGLGMGSTEPQRCERTLIFDKQRVVEQTWLGTSSFCSDFKKKQEAASK